MTTPMLYQHGTFKSLASDGFAHTGGGWELVRNQNGGVQSLVKKVTCEFFLTGDDAVTLNARFRQIREALSRDGVDSGFLLPNGQPSEIFIRNSETIGGVLVFAPPLPLADEGSNFATGLKGSFTVAAEFTAEQAGFAAQPGLTLSAFQESFSVRGNGGPRRAIVEYDQGEPEEFILADRTMVGASQVGFAVLTGASGAFPSPTAPYYPDHLMNEADAVTRVTTQQSAGKYANRTDWNYEYQKTTPFTGSTQPQVRTR